MDKELKKKLKEVQKQVIEEDKMRKRFISSKLDYNFIQYMLNKVDNDNDLIVDITTCEGHRIVISRKTNNNNNTPTLFNDVISPEDIR